ncbi:hypothetical protein LWI28_016120 [Acer negundo]|uniref:Uncharacterized protein n=1 Tax=Acer negundo TaxID=4023 RepID=A0AAD5J539_ACENE|nr:hypothetical protein LWI28_016120 [Acer negundo]
MERRLEYALMKYERVVKLYGKAGGLCLFWNVDVNVALLSYSVAHINVRVEPIGKLWWRFTGFYGNQRVHSWSLLRRLAGMYSLPWVCMRDFNEVFSSSKKIGGLPKEWKALADFREALDDSGLEDLGYIGPHFTLTNKRQGVALIYKRLD